MKMRKNISRNLLNYRKKYGYSQEHIANYLDIEKRIINDYENVKRDISLVHLNKLCDLFNIELEDFIKPIPINKIKKLVIPINHNVTKQDMISIASFHRAINNYIKMNEMIKKK
jgi:transcriptional regulator with XRE-family HTH domain